MSDLSGINAQASADAGRGIDIDALRAKYKKERDRRVRADGEAQYSQPVGELAHFAEEDPNVEPGYVRDSLTLDKEVVIIGGGFAGLITAGRLGEAGITDVAIIDSAADFGGTWYWNRYPGAQCDIESYCYLPMLEETGYIPKEKYSFAPEIFEHAKRIGEKFALKDKAIFQTRVEEVRWDESVRKWKVKTNRGDDIQARFLVNATGPVNRPKLPAVPGIHDFSGHSFHTSRWDYDYTGGDNKGNLHKLKDKRVAIIGTGCTAVQCIPFLGKYAKQLYVFQRTPTVVSPRNNKPTDPEWASSLEPGWQLKRQENFNSIVAGLPFDEDLVKDGWTELYQRIRMARFPVKGRKESGLSPEEEKLVAELIDAEKMNEIRADIEETIKDPEVAEILKPWYRFFCKRPTFNDDYVDTFNRDNVTVVDTSETQGVERITENGIFVNGKEYDVDCIIFSTGFEITSSVRKRIGFEIYGRNGESVYDHWSPNRVTLHGHSTHGFPNWFFIGNSQNGVSVNYSLMMEDQARHITYIIGEVKKRGAQTIEATAEAEQAWVAEIRRLATNANSEFYENCTPGYYNNEGKFDIKTSLFGDFYPLGSQAFNELMQEWRKEGNCEGMVFE